MKFTSALSALLVVLPAVTAIVIPPPVHATEILRRDDIVARKTHEILVARKGKKGKNGQNKNGNKKGGNNTANNNNNAANNTTVAAVDSTSVAAADSTSVAVADSTSVAAADNTIAAANNNNNNNNGGNNNNNNGGNNNNNNGGNNNNNPQTSLTLDPQVVAAGLAQDGQNPPVAGQVASLTTTNNFINFCAGQTITNGLQVKTGSCNPVPMGDIIPQANMPSSKFKFPTNFSTIPANQAFNAQLAIQNMDTGHFVNAQKNYFAAPQQLTPQGILLAHSHIVIQKMGDFGSPDILDPTAFAFFKGLNDAAVGGVLTAAVAGGLAPGNYRMASINTSANHAPAVAAVAQHGFFDDIVYFTAQ